MARTRDPEATRIRLLDAGLDALRIEPAQRLFERLQARPITDRAGLSIGSFYDHFDGPDEYVAALLEYALAKDENPPFARARRAFEEAVAAGATFVDAAASGCTAALVSQDGNPTFALQMAVWSKVGRDPAMLQRVRRTYELVQRETTAFYADLLEALSLEMRPPFKLEDAAGSIMALFEGFTLRRGVQMSDDEAAFGRLVLTVVALMTRPAGDDQDAEAWLGANAPSWSTST